MTSITSTSNGNNNSLSPAEAHLHRTLELLAFERDIDLAQTSLLASKASPKLLESRGLAILGLHVSSLSVGLGGKTLVELERWMKGPFPSHEFRNGDTCEILGNDSATKTSTGLPKGGKGKEREKEKDLDSQKKNPGVIYRVHEDKIVIALDSQGDNEEPSLPERCRLCVRSVAIL